jgi:hypothetical protein
LPSQKVAIPWEKEIKNQKEERSGRIHYGNSRRKKLIKAKLKRSAARKATPAAASEEAAAKPKRTIAKKKTDA